MVPWLRRFAAFAFLPLLATLGSLLSLPLVARSVDSQDWAALTVGQSIGLLTAIVIGLGWPVVGAALVAQAEPEGQERIYADALVSRGLAAALFGPIAIGVAAWLAPGQGRSSTCALMAAATCLSGLSVAWFCVGRAAPRDIAVFEIAPRFLGLVLGSLAVVATGNASVYPAIIAISTAGGLFAYTRRVLGSSPRRVLSATTPWQTLLGHGRLAFIEVSAASFTSGLGFLSGFTLTVQDMAGLGSGDRMCQVMLQLVAALSNTVHPWVAMSDKREFRRRTNQASTLHAAAGVLCLLTMGLLGPFASALLFGPRLQAPLAVCWGLGAYLLFVNLQTIACRHILVTRGLTGPVIRANVLASGLGVPMVLLGANIGGPAGAVVGMAAGELSIFLFALPSAVRCFRQSTLKPA